MRVKLVLIVFVLLSLAACDAFAPPSLDESAVWQAWLINDDGQMITVNARGRVDQTPSDLPANVDAAGDDDPTSDLFVPTGERIALQLDTRFAQSPSAEFNTVFLYEPIDRVNFPFFFSPNLNLQSVFFVQNGERILIHGQDAEMQDYWLLIERDGSLVRPLRNIERTDLHGTAGGFIYTLSREDGTENRTELVNFNTRRPFSDEVVWTGEGHWHIVAVENGAMGYGAFRAWRPLAVPVYSVPSATPPPMTPTAFPTPVPLLIVGEQAEVNTIDGEVLYLRDEASTGGAIVRYLYDRMIVDLLEGPVYAEGYTWWRVRTADGEIGWAAEAVDTVTTLLPADHTPESTPESTPDSNG